MKKERVSIVECSSYSQKQVDSAVKKALGEINVEFPAGSRVLVKPNMLSAKPPEKAVSTHPAVLEAVLKLLKQRKCKIIVGESSGWNTAKAFEVCGLGKIAKKYGAKIAVFEKEKIRTIIDGKNKILKTIGISEIPFRVDFIINLPKMKTHCLMKVTLAIKNLFGLIPGGTKQVYHIKGSSEKKFGDLLIDIYKQVKPKILVNIMDAIVGMEGEGPGNGNPKKTGLILASTDAVALDIVAAKIMGFNPESVFTTKRAIERGMFPGIDNVSTVSRIPEIKYKKSKPHFYSSTIPRIVERLWPFESAHFPVLKKEKCIKCGVCKSVCASGAIKLTPYPKFNRNKCIRCYCCHENCPKGAIDLKQSIFFKGLRSFLSKTSRLFSGKR